MKRNTVYYASSKHMVEVDDRSVDLIVTSPPYYNIKDYTKDGFQAERHSEQSEEYVSFCRSFDEYINNLLAVWRECERVLKPNGKLCINVPLMPMLKRDLDTHYNRHIYDIQSSIQQSILRNTGLYLLDIYIWNRTNPSKKLMFGSYPYPRNFYAQNTVEFISVYVRDGKPEYTETKEQREDSKLTQEEWIEFTKQIWDIPIPSRGDTAFGKHSAIMPEEIVNRCVRMFTMVNDIVLDPFAGSGTTLKVAKRLRRNYIGYELYGHYRDIIEEKLQSVRGTARSEDKLRV